MSEEKEENPLCPFCGSTKVIAHKTGLIWQRISSYTCQSCGQNFMHSSKGYTYKAPPGYKLINLNKEKRKRKRRQVKLHRSGRVKVGWK